MSSFKRKVDTTSQKLPPGACYSPASSKTILTSSGIESPGSIEGSWSDPVPGVATRSTDSPDGDVIIDVRVGGHMSRIIWSVVILQDHFPSPPSAFFHLLAPFADAYFYPNNEWDTSDECNDGDNNIVRELHGGRWYTGMGSLMLTICPGPDTEQVS